MSGKDPFGEWLDVECPCCGEKQSLLVEFDVEGELVQDCEVCCKPWKVTVRRPEGRLQVDLEAL